MKKFKTHFQCKQHAVIQAESIRAIGSNTRGKRYGGEFDEDVKVESERREREKQMEEYTK